ncbi:MAG: EAL domain-containing protein, partial [Acidobacteria bacterium]|nr:EAL domain-containing protein [Acidobacteriota bacterium]
IPVAVNLSARQLQDSSFLDRVLDTLDRTELDPSLLELELTETACFESGEAGRAVFSALRERGVGLALDDFGTGYGSLQVLHSFPIRKIKIPGLFVHAAEDRELDAAILHAAADLGQSVGITVVAEGVETPKQLAMVLATRCHAAQGFLLGRPSIVPQLRSKAAFSSLAGRHPLQQGSAAPPSSYSAGR